MFASVCLFCQGKIDEYVKSDSRSYVKSALMTSRTKSARVSWSVGSSSEGQWSIMKQASNLDNMWNAKVDYPWVI